MPKFLFLKAYGLYLWYLALIEKSIFVMYILYKKYMTASQPRIFL
jgi:hypothetical protein